MIERSKLFWLIPLLLVLNGQSLGEEQIASQELLESADEILEAVSKIRDLEIKRPVAKGIKTRDEIKAFLLEKIEEEYPIEDVMREERFLKRLGFLPAAMDLYAFMLDLLTEQLAGYYDPETETFFIADWIPLVIQKPVMAHELTHALQDQHFDLEEYLERTEGNDDSTLARSALIEGEGFLLMLDYSLQPMGRSSLDIPDIIEAQRAQTAMMDAQFEIYATAPNYLRETLVFPYTYGGNFLQEVVRRYSWSRVNEIYHDLPASTEQILHPSKYLDQRDSPTPVDSSEYLTALSDDWKTVYTNVLGEFVIYLLLKESLDEGIALSASKGWDGDSTRLIEGPGGKEILILDTIWDSNRDADQFQTAYIALLKKKFPGLYPTSSRPQILKASPGKIDSWETDCFLVAVSSEANRVVFVELDKTAPCSEVAQ